MRNGDSPIRFEEVFAVVTLAHKYGIEDIQAQALSFLEDTGYFSSKLHRFQNPDSKKLSVEPAHAIGAVILAKLTDTPSMLPSALFRGCALGGDLLDGWSRADGTVWHLALDDAKRCVSARTKIAHVGWRTFRMLFDDTVNVTCARRDKCRTGLRKLGAAAQDRQSMERSTLWNWSDDLCDGLTDGWICESCYDMLEERNRLMLRRVWECLPALFGLAIDPWPTT